MFSDARLFTSQETIKQYKRKQHGKNIYYRIGRWIGALSAKALIAQGHFVVLHARDTERKRDALKINPEAEAVLTGDLSSIEETKKLAFEANKLAPFDAVIHNAGVYQTSSKEIFAVNVLAPYILTALVQKPKRLIYLTSGMHLQGRAKFDNFKIGQVSYSDSKLYVLILCKAAARLWTNVYANAVDPGWVPTKMGGGGAPDDLQKGYATQVWLAVSKDEKAKVSGRYFFHQKERHSNPEGDDILLQEKFLDLCKKITGVSISQ